MRAQEVLQSKQSTGNPVHTEGDISIGWKKGKEASGSGLSQEIAPSSSQVEESWEFKFNHPKG